ncbi:hypothetical protein CEN46_05800, partial [Fischerella thermalis CCMEE 5318]
YAKYLSNSHSSVISVPLWFDFLELLLKFNSKIFLTRNEVVLRCRQKLYQFWILDFGFYQLPITHYLLPAYATV